MKKKTLHSATPRAARPDVPAPPRASLPTADIRRCLLAWVQEGVYRQLSPRTNENRKMFLGKLVWFLETNALPQCGDPELREFFLYLTTAHADKGGRWGISAAQPEYAAVLHQPPRSRTTAAYHAYLRAFFSWAVAEGVLDESPMRRIKPPPAAKDQADPFTPSQIDAFIAAAKDSLYPARDAAVVWLLYDTGMRVGELSQIRLGDVDLLEKRLRVKGKGNKERTVSFGLTVSRALWAYLREGRRDPTSLAAETLASAEAFMRMPLFLATRGRGAGSGEGMCRQAFYKIVRRLADAAGIQRRRVGPHTFRNTFAVEFLADGGSEKACQELMGHSSLAMTHHYAKLAGAHIGAEHRLHSPADKHKRRVK